MFGADGVTIDCYRIKLNADGVMSGSDGVETGFMDGKGDRLGQNSMLMG